MYVINERITVPEHEVWFEFSHATGPGGQHVNKASTRATLCFSLSDSGALSEEQKALATERLSSRLAADGVLRVSCDGTRSQSTNRLRAGERFCELLREAITPPVKRKPTREPLSRIRRRLDDKAKRSALKRDRQKYRF